MPELPTAETCGSIRCTPTRLAQESPPKVLIIHRGNKTLTMLDFYHIASCRRRDMGVNMTYPYQFGSGVTSKVLVIRRGTNDRICPMTQVSNQAIDVKELDSLVLYMEEQRVPHIMRSNVEKQKALLKDAEK